MKKGGDRSIIRVRTFYEDVARARGTEVPKGPTLKKEDKTAQTVADQILHTQTHKATDFMTAGTSQKDMLTPDIEVEIDVAPEEVLASDKGAPSGTEAVPQPQKNNLAIAGLEEEILSVGKIHTQSVQTTEGAVYDVSNNDLEEGTLITNKKLKKHRLLPSLFVAFISWFSNTKTELTTPKTPEHTVNSAKSRIETITAAARESKHAPHSDHGVMIKRLTKTKKKAPVKAMSITKKENVAAPQWGSSTDTELSQTNEEVREIVVEEIVPVPEIVKEPEIVSEPEVVQILTNVQEPEVVPIPEVSQVEVKEPEVVDQVTMAEQVTPEPEPEPEVVTLAPVEKKEKEVSPKKRAYRTTPAPVSGVSLYVYILVIVGASLLGIGISVYWFMSSTPTQESVVIRIPSLFASDVIVPVQLSTNSSDTLSTILDMSVDTRETTQIYPVITDATGAQTPADAQTILTALGFRAPGSFTRAVTDISFGSYNGTDPFILMKVTNFDIAFGGILDWEPDLSEDLSPLFGTPVTQSYDPYARTDTQVRSAFFRDTVIANKSARLLVDAEDDERLLYSFIRPNLILITTNSDTFKAILPLVSQ